LNQDSGKVALYLFFNIFLALELFRAVDLLQLSIWAIGD